jgi:hypothetical protein
MRTFVYHLPHIGIFIVATSLWDLCSAATLSDVCMARVLAVALIGVLVAFAGFAINPE